MKHHNMLPYRAWMAATLLAIGASAEQTYCSSQNTGSGDSQATSIYMSNGLCSDTCRSQYAFAIVSYQSCFCSNYIPADQESTSNCSQNCPGYPDDKCGDADSGLYGYIALDIAPSGTAGAGASSTQQPSSTAPSSTQEPETSYVSTTSVQTATSSPSVVVSVTRPTTSTTSTRAPVTSTSLPPTTEDAATPTTNVIMTTISGAVVTQTVTSTPIAASGSQNQVPIHRNDGLGAGATAGIVLGVLVAIALAAAVAFLLWRRNRNDDNERQGGSEAGSKKSMTRNVSVLSKAGLLSRNNTRPSMAERDHDDGQYITAVTGQNSVRHSMLFAGNDGVSPTSPLGSSHSSGSRRLSKPMVYDQRLNPSVLFANQEANGSRVSMQDTQDYSRPLGVMNPDPRPSFESRNSHRA